MLAAALCLQASLLVQPLFLDEERPELRSAQHILLLHDDIEGLPLPLGRDHEETVELAHALHARLAEGADFSEAARRYSSARTGRTGGSLGTYPRGVLGEPLDSWLFSAELGELSPVFDTDRGVHLLRRVETHAGARILQLPDDSPSSRELAAELLEELAAGADFQALAREHSADAASAQRGGDYKVFERGSRDALLKAAAFEARVGEVVGPIETPLGLYLLQRVAPEALAPELWEDNLIRARAILVSHLSALGVDPDIDRTQTEAKDLAERIVRQVEAGEDLAEIAARFNDDPGGKERAGDLGWIHRHHPDLPHFFQQLYLKPPGTLLDPIQTPAGYVVIRREL